MCLYIKQLSVLHWLHESFWLCETVSHSVMSDSLWFHRLKPARLLCPWSSPGKNIGVGCHSFLQGIFPSRDRTWVSCIAGRFFTIWATREDCVDQNKLWKILKAMGIPDYLIFILRNLYMSQEATVRTGHGTMEKEFNKTVYGHPAYLTSRKSTSCEMPGWMNHKLESRLLREISTTSNMHMIPP